MLRRAFRVTRCPHSRTALSATAHYTMTVTPAFTCPLTALADLIGPPSYATSHTPADQEPESRKRLDQAVSRHPPSPRRRPFRPTQCSDQPFGETVEADPS